MELITYTGSTQEPRVGDIIKTKYTSRWETPEGIEVDKEYEVLKVGEFKSSYSVTVRGMYGNKKLSAKNFKLVKSGLPPVTLTDEKIFMCILDNNIVSAHSTNEEAQNASIDIIGFDHKKQVVIAQVLSVAKVKKPEINFV